MTGDDGRPPSEGDLLVLHCVCGASFVGPVHNSVQEKFSRAWYQVHCGDGHGYSSEPVRPPSAQHLMADLLEDPNADVVGHTPGPWAVKKHTDTKGWTVSGAGGKSVASVQPQPGDVEAEANAHLIKAAPDLRAALRDLVRAWQNMALRPNEEMDAALRCAEAARTKARGGQA